MICFQNIVSFDQIELGLLIALAGNFISDLLHKISLKAPTDGSRLMKPSSRTVSVDQRPEPDSTRVLASCVGQLAVSVMLTIATDRPPRRPAVA